MYSGRDGSIRSSTAQLWQARVLMEEGFGDRPVMFDPSPKRRVKVSQTKAEEPCKKEALPCAKAKAQRKFNMECVKLSSLVWLEPLYF